MQWRALASPDAVAAAATTTVTEYRAFWEAMAADRTTAAATLVWLVARVVALSFPDDRADVAEVLNGMISAGGSSATSPTASDRARGPPAARIDTRRQLLLRQPVLASIYFLTVMVPFDPYHPAVQRAMERWRDDLKTNISGGERDLFESEVRARPNRAEQGHNNAACGLNKAACGFRRHATGPFPWHACPRDMAPGAHTGPPQLSGSRIPF